MTGGDLLVRWAQLAPNDPKSGDLLTAVIEAIEARGWTWAMNGRADGCIGYVYTGDNFQRYADTPAAALLAAYVAALEAEADQ